ncbi:MAG: hypothetical protein AAF663_05790 [Planctomycetota bacterium]
MIRLVALVSIALLCGGLLAWQLAGRAVPTSASTTAVQAPPESTEPSEEAPEVEGRGEAEVPPQPVTTNADLDRWLRKALPEVEIENRLPGHWRFELLGRPMMIVTDERAGRMRIISPVAPSPRDPAELQRMLEANYRTALDARYALDGDLLWSAFIHPLPTLNRDEFLDGLGQTYTLAETYGTTYSSSGLRFGPEGPERQGDDRDGPSV